MKLYLVKATIVRRSTAFYRVFAKGGAEAERLVQQGDGERVGKPVEDVVERASYNAKLDKAAAPGTLPEPHIVALDLDARLRLQQQKGDRL